MFNVWFVIGTLFASFLLSILPWFYYSHWIRDKKLVNEKIPKWKDTNKPKIWLMYWIASYATAIVVYIIAYIIIYINFSFEQSRNTDNLLHAMTAFIPTSIYSVIVIAINAWIINIIAKRTNNGIKPKVPEQTYYKDGMSIQDLKSYNKHQARAQAEASKDVHFCGSGEEESPFSKDIDQPNSNE